MNKRIAALWKFLTYDIWRITEDEVILPILPVRCPPAKMDTLARALLAFVRPEQSGPLPAHGIREPLAQDGLEMRERRF